MRRSIVLLLMLAFAGVAWAAPHWQTTDFNTALINTRADLETLANQVFGEGQRPPAWTFNVNNVTSTTFVADMWFDNEQVADQLFNKSRPPGWIGAPTTKDPLIVVRNVRHDLELAADQEYGLNNRPTGWRGGPSLFRCDRTLQNLVGLLTNVFGVKFTTAQDAVNYCLTIAAEAEGATVQKVLSGEALTSQAPDLILAVRGDLERLADEKQGLNNRPQGWIGNKDAASPTLASDISLDLESLANTLLPGQPRPNGWIGAPLPNNPILAYRTLRHDLELLANAVGQTPRPRGWQGTDPGAVCDPGLQNLVAVVTQAYGFSTQNVAATGDYCANLAQAANQAAENPPIVEATPEPSVDERFTAESRYAFAYLDPAASQYMGAMPAGTKFRAWYRNYGKSTMMFVSGQDFAVYIDLRWTTLSPDVFERLPTTEGVKPLTFCDAKWCNGPGPTPTPTGSGALALLLQQGTPPAPPETGQGGGNKTQVSWNYIRVTYLSDNATTRTAQVTLEICADTTQTDCEPVTSVFDKGAGAPKPVISQSNGLNVYEFPYGYSSNLVIESASRTSPDVWISDPTIR